MSFGRMVVVCEFALPESLCRNGSTLSDLGGLSNGGTIMIINNNSVGHFNFLSGTISCLGRTNVRIGLVRNMRPSPSIRAIVGNTTIVHRFRPS